MHVLWDMVVRLKEIHVVVRLKEIHEKEDCEYVA